MKQTSQYLLCIFFGSSLVLLLDSGHWQGTWFREVSYFFCLFFAFCQLDTILVFWEEKTSLKALQIWLDCGHVCGRIVFQTDPGEPVPLWVVSSHGGIRKPAKHKPAGSVHAFKLLPLNPCSEFPQWWTMTRKNKPNKSFLPELFLVMVVATAAEWS